MIARPYFTAAVADDGSLLLTADNEARAWIKEEQERGQSEDDILWSGLEGYWNNGSFYPFDAGQANPFVGLSSAPCIAEDMTVEDDGTKVINGRFWAFMDYQVISFIDELKTKGRVLFHQP